MVARGHHQLQDLHGVSERADGGRPHDLQADGADKGAGRAGVRACGERHGDRRDRAGGACGREHRAALPCAHAAHDRRGRGRASRRSRSANWRAGQRSTSCMCPAKTRCWRWPRGAGGGCLSWAKPVPSTWCCRSKTTWASPGSKTRSMCLRPRCARSEIRQPLWEALKRRRAAGGLDRPLPVPLR